MPIMTVCKKDPGAGQNCETLCYQSDEGYHANRAENSF